MKNLTRILMIMVVAILPLSMDAQDVEALVELSNQYSQLQTQIKELNGLIKQEEDKSFTLRTSWYNTCKIYLQKRQFKAEELQSLINQTIPEIDGQELYDELLNAKDCLDSGNEYQYKDIPAPTRNSVVTPTASSNNKPKENSKKKDGNKNVDKNNKKKDKKTPPSNDKKENPVVDNDADKKDTTPKQEEPIVTDPSKDRNGEDKPSAPVVKKDSDKEDETAPVTTPVVSDPKKSNPSKVEKKRDKGEMEEGTSKKSKNNDGSR